MTKKLNDHERLIDFLQYVAREGYASDKSPITRLKDGSRDLVLEKSGLCFHDNWFGGEPFGGREVVSQNGRVFWMATYYGGFESDAVEGTKVLREAMRLPDDNFPVRGPRSYSSRGYQYTYQWKGDIYRFESIEKIFDSSGRQIYQAEISGGLVDQ